MQNYGKNYYYIDANDKVMCISEINYRIDRIDKEKYNIANYCTDKNLIQQQAYREILNRQLWRFTYQNDWKSTEGFDYGDCVVGIYYDCSTGCFNTYWEEIDTMSLNSVYFTSERIAKKAINEIVKPFMEQHPDFNPRF